MPSLLDIRRRIRAVRSTQQITKAMKMVAASRLRRAQERAMNARPFADEMLRVLQGLVGRVDADIHPLLDRRAAPPPESKALLFVITADRGLCGSFNTNIIKAAGGFLTEQRHGRVALGLVGRKGRDFFRRQALEVVYEQVNVFAHLTFGDAQAIAGAAIEAFTERRVDAVYLAYNQFKSVLQQKATIERLLPIRRIEAAEPSAPTVDYLYEPAPDRIFDRMLPHYVEIEVYRALLESSAAEHAARMTAMDAATRNSAEMIEGLTLYMNKVRQAAITREIIEVVSGAEAL